MDKLLKAGGILFLAMMITNIFNYLFQITMGRLITPIEYGLMNSLLAIFMIMSIPLGTIFMVISRQTAEYKAKGEFDKIRGLFNLTYGRVLYIGFFGLLVFWSISVFIKNYLHAPSAIPVIILGLAIFVSVIPLINIAVLQGLQNFRWMTLGLGLGGPLKFLFCLILVTAGLSVNGVMGGLLFVNIAMGIITYMPIKKDIGHKKENSMPDSINLMSIYSILLANLSFAVMTQADMVLVKNLFSGHEAGIYASASILGKAVMYLPGAIVLAMFPMVAESNALKLKSGHLIKKSIIVSLLMSGSGAMMLFFFPELIIRIFFGVKYIEGVDTLRYFGVAILPMALLMILMNYFIAKGVTVFSYVMVVGALLEMALILLFHKTLIAVIFNIMTVGAVITLAGFLLLYLENKIIRRDYLIAEQLILPKGK